MQQLGSSIPVPVQVCVCVFSFVSQCEFEECPETRITTHVYGLRGLEATPDLDNRHQTPDTHTHIHIETLALRGRKFHLARL